MQLGTVGTYPVSVGSLIALVVLVLAIVFIATGTMDMRVGGLIAALAVARLT